MPYEFQVLCCYACEKFQVHQVKKAKKWECKVCGAKQSLIKAFKIGNPRECRQVVQQLNMEQGLRSEQANESVEQTDYEGIKSENNFFRPERDENSSESEEEEFVRDDCENRSLVIPGLETSNNADATRTHQPSSLRDTLRTFYCAMSMNGLDVCKREESRETEKLSLGSTPASMFEKPAVAPPKATLSRKNKGFELIKEAAKRRKRSVE